ncbi:MAG: hypothetical protein ACYS4T_17240 [Planctomycetota bacterium]|jgi:hypothetical protein
MRWLNLTSIGKENPPELLSFVTRWNFTQISLSFNYLIEHTTATAEGTYYKLHDLYLRTDAEQRGTLLIIALRRYKNENGRWPEGLDEVKGLAAEEVFVDPINGDSFVYKLTEDNFTLYSRGKNNVDEGGKRKGGSDDWLIWPPKGSKTKEENADAEQQ